MKELSEYITEYVSSGRRGKFNFPEELKDIKTVIEFLEFNGFSDATQRTHTDSMPDILSTFKKSNEPIYIYDEYDISGEKSYWLRFFDTKKPTRNITEENPIFTVSYTGYDNDHYFIEKTVGDETITRVSRGEFIDLMNKHFGWS